MQPRTPLRKIAWALALWAMSGCASASSSTTEPIRVGPDAATVDAAPRSDDGLAPDARVADALVPPPRAQDAVAPPEPVDAALPPTFDASRCTPAALEAIAAAVERELRGQSGQGAALAIVCGGEMRLERAFGSVREGGPAVTNGTRFQWASTTKMLTAALALALAEDGVVDLDAPIGAHLPGMHDGGLTLHHLLSHTSGFATSFDRHDPDLETVVANNARQPLWSRPGEVWNYSNPGFAVAGAVLQAAAAEPFGPLLERRVLLPAGLLDTTFSVEVVLQGEHADGHSGAPGAAQVIRPDGAYFHTTYYGPMGGAWGTAADLARWGLALAARPSGVLSREGFAALTTPHARTTFPGRDYGYGHFLEQGISPRWVTHSGTAPGFVSYFTAVPEAGVALAVLSNSDWVWLGGPLDDALADLVEMAFDPGAVHPVADSPQRYVGRYDDPVNFGGVTVREVESGLEATFESTGRTEPLTHLWADSFEVQWGGETVDFNFWHDPGEDAGYVVSLWGVARRVQ